MSLSNDPGQTTVDEGYLRRIGALGRPLREGTSPLEERQRNNLKRFEQRALKEAASQTRIPEGDITGVWKAYDKYGDMSIRKLSEAVSESAMPQLLRFGVQNFLFDGYASVPTIYPDLVRVISSSGAEELYAPLYGVELPTQLSPGQEYGDSRLLGLDVHVPNDKFGRLLSIERELIEDDRTGQIVTRAGQLGERMRYVEEQQVINVLTATNGPTGVAQYTTTIGNTSSSGPATSGASVDQASIKAADIALEQMLDPLGNKMLVMPDTILVSPSGKFDAAVLLNSALQPSVPGTSGETAGSATGGETGWTMSVNPLQGLYALKVSRFLPSTGGLNTTGGKAFLMEAKKSLVFQERTALQVMQEAVNSGGSFDRDVYRYRADRRFAAALIEPRYVYEIN